MTTKRNPAGPVRMKPTRAWATIEPDGSLWDISIYKDSLWLRRYCLDRIARVEVREVVRKRKAK